MKGIIFTEFIEMVESRFSVEVAEQIIAAAELSSGGSYTSLGTYSHQEILNLVTRLSAVSGANPVDLQCAFGEYLFGRFSQVHPEFFQGVKGSFEFLSKVQGYIHIEVRKLYPDSNPPKLTCKPINEHCMELHYESHRPFAPLALGLIKGCGMHFGERLNIHYEPLTGTGDGTEARFHLTIEG
ncbi:heme NO-binding domain-containing protein [Endozoicomonas sp. SCSIO W0465]|uniref:heme NO-binding domain-containing protein n=1 Tax=Endozoicomonas sp. SCSIO W0465 TaxID=2918516 RepID=UPI002075CB53|nr:heme NO-binding domain-containing protein [Endozoicomonas sp. SCSIO W0465]USE33786.1 heme NO-binding domain-containing protein [Endozoicomonas sp. SCSIO W0465]